MDDLRLDIPFLCSLETSGLVKLKDRSDDEMDF